VEAQKQISRQGGFKPAKGFDEIRERVAAKNAIDYDGDGEVAGWFARAVRPVSELVSDSVGSMIGRKFENAFETATRNSELVTTKYLKAPDTLLNITKWAEQPAVKAAFLDLRSSGAKGRGAILAQAGKELGAPEVRVLNELFKDAAAHQKEGARLFRKDVRTDEIYWPSEIKRTKADEIEALRSEADQTNPKHITSTGPRGRKLGSEMEPEELDTYDSPITALITRMAGEQQLLQLAKQFELPPTLSKSENVDEFFDALESKFLKESGDASKARIGRNLIEETYRGARKSPPKGVELFMKQSYAGTLGQFDSAILNLHDIAVSAMRNGTKPTFKALVSKGFDPRELGITGTAKSMGEFREGFDLLAERGMWEKGADWYQDFAFKWSGFRDLDRFGKGTVLKAAWNMAQDSAKAGKLVEDFGYMMKPNELAQINTVLKNKTALSDMTEKQRELVTQLMFSRLGEQQLISAVGRPLAYLKNPKFRFMYAMTGFAIKQAEMMKKGAWDNFQKGNYKAAGEFMYRYMMFAGVGYGIVNQTRGSIQYAMGNEDKKPSLGGFTEDVFMQPLAAATFNRMGDSYSIDQFKRDPWDAAFSSFQPPAGLVGNLGKDVSAIAFDHGFTWKTLNSWPGGDELRALLNN
jgi:hypothetical protein